MRILMKIIRRMRGSTTRVGRIFGYLIFGKKVYVHDFFYVGDRKNVRIGNRCSINIDVYIPAQCRVEIGDDVTLSARCMLLDSGLNIADNNSSRDHIEGSIKIEDGVWVGAGAIILPNVVIGAGSIIGAGSVVTRSVPRMCVVAGNPARILRRLD